MLLLALAMAVGYVVLDRVVMPAYTRFDDVLNVPDVRDMTLEEAHDTLSAQSLTLGEPQERYDGLRKLNRILSQNPRAGAPVKPGRMVYVTVNAGAPPPVQVPKVEGASLRSARNQLEAAGLVVKSELPDESPNPYRGSVTRQDPPPHSVVAPGDSVALWYSTGLRDHQVTVPDVVGLRISDAQQTLAAQGLRSTVLHQNSSDADPIIVRQSREAGARVQQGFVIRLFTRQ